ncbi:MAG TPA: murein biosynthesis integral membrane protein MurJ, partial [Deltaproteobacteria bacterium]|nr:murein biosynthesis integral membrane protein MurJ [Deltaproteobacteria bacterium]
MPNLPLSQPDGEHRITIPWLQNVAATQRSPAPRPIGREILGVSSAAALHSPTSMSTPLDPPPSHRVNFVRAFLASALGTGLSRVLGAARDVVIAGLLGASASSDAFWIAFTIPNVFRRFVADEGLTGAMIPALAQARAEEGPEAVRRLAASTFGALVVANLVLCLVGILAAEPLVLAFAWSWRDDPEQLQMATTMTRWMFPFVAMVSTVSFFEGLLNFRGHFFVPKIAPGLVSAGMVAGALSLSTRLEEPAFSLVIGVLAGGLVHVLVNLVPLWRLWGRVGLALRMTPRLRALLSEMSKVLAIGVFAQINLLVLRQLATSLPEGAVTHYVNGTRIVDLAQGMVAVAIGSALLPNLSASVAEASWGRFRSDLTGALRLAAFLLLPIAVVVYVWAEPAAALLFRHGRYSWEDTLVTASAVRYLVPFLLAVAAVNILKRVFFALEDRTTLLVVGGMGVALTGVIGTLLVSAHGVAGLSLALSVA